jgi:AraC-like DNA-binding protein
MVPRDFRAEQAMLLLDDLTVRRGQASVGLSIVGGLSNRHVFTFAVKQAVPRMMMGREVPPGVMFHPRPGDMLATWSPKGDPFPWASLSIGFDALAQAGASLTGRDVAPSRMDAALITPQRAAYAHLLWLVEDFAAVATRAPETVDHHTARAAMTGALLDAMVACLGVGTATRDRAAVRRHQQILRRLETVLREPADSTLGIAALCAMVGVSRRTLHEVCMTLVGMPPMRYARRHRLGLVRKALLGASPHADTVTDIALRHGFWEMGRFSSAYREAFGEAPSVTLKRDFA